ncbi:TRAP transporter small permease [Sneathiella sp. CAU 1612]|jgi:TRAP-type C4-dicarboxylate transport system permease small subunit|uniref:TRAP transporter small permease protein n=1 Tax=Sneathiella sedimenti TaxID=2816034 RepID=A0ABS3F692_9PROT|nr:TRAP transporter small permease [Sneathiella sedimenti]MBO0333894.1 TRAP transporter small permease [Sneathiella sedimenti]
MEHEKAADTEDSPQEKYPFRIEEAIGALAMGLICLISILNVVVRYATNVSFAFTEEYSVFLLVIVTFVGAGLAYTNKGHICITFVVNKLGRPGQFFLNSIAFFSSVIMFALLVYYGSDLAIDEYLFEETSPALGYPTWIYTMWLPLLSLAVLVRIFQVQWNELRKKK